MFWLFLVIAAAVLIYMPWQWFVGAVVVLGSIWWLLSKCDTAKQKTNPTTPEQTPKS